MLRLPDSAGGSFWFHAQDLANPVSGPNPAGFVRSPAGCSTLDRAVRYAVAGPRGIFGHNAESAAAGRSGPIRSHPSFHHSETMRLPISLSTLLGLALATVAPAQFDPNLGIDAGGGPITPDDAILGPLNLGFPFRFPDGSTHTSIEIDTNGRVLPGGSGAASVFNENPALLLSEPTALCPYWDDLTPLGIQPDARGRIYFFTDGASRANVTFCNVKRFGVTTFDHTDWTFQVQLESSDVFRFVYDERVFSTNSILVGASAGGGAIDPGEVDLGAGHASSGTAADANVYEYFSTSSAPFDLMGRSVTYTPSGAGGYDVSVGAAGVTPCGAEMAGEPCPQSFHFIPDGAGGYLVQRGLLDFGDGSGGGFFDDGGVGAPNTIEWGVGLGDDSNAGPFVPASPSFGFRFPGATSEATEFWIDNNGRVMPDNTDPGDFNASVAEFLAGPPTIATFWTDMSSQRGSLRSYDDPAGLFVSITWDHTPKFNESLPLTFQVVLRDDDSFSLHYREVSNWLTGSGFTSDDVLIGCSPGGGHPDPGEHDFTTVTPITLGESAIYEFWDSDTERPDIHTTLYPSEPDIPRPTWTQPVLGEPFTLTMEGVSANTVSSNLLLQLGPTPPGFPVDLSILGLSGCELGVNPTVAALPMTIDPLEGTSSLTLNIPDVPGFEQLEIHGQGANIDVGANPLNVVLSNVARGRVTAPAPCPGPVCFYQGCYPGLQLCLTGQVPGAAGNVDVRFTFVAESANGPGANCTITALQTVTVVNQPACLPLTCAVIPPACLPNAGGNALCPGPPPPTPGAYVLATLVEVFATGTTTLLYTCSPGKIDCNCAPTTCP